MTPKIICPSCSGEVSFDDKFCSSCGTKLDWSQKPSESSKTAQGETQSPIVGELCSQCGNQNPVGTEFCESCGAPLKSGGTHHSNVKKSATTSTVQREKVPPLKGFQSWKLTVALAIVFIAAIVITRYTGSAPAEVTPAGIMQDPAHSGADMEELQNLEEAVKSNPNDANMVLHLANKLQDMKFYDRAITVYHQYLNLQPQNPDAHVDLGVTFFQLSLADSMKHHNFLDSAATSVHQAIVINPRHQMALYNMGIISLHTGDMKKSMEWFIKCAQVDTTTETGKRALLLINQHSINNPS